MADNLKLDIERVSKDVELVSYTKNFKSYLIVTKKRGKNNLNQVVISDLPIKINKLTEQINLGILKTNFSLKSNIQVGKYLLDINSREISYKKIFLKLTEQEVKILIYLKESKKNIKVDQLQKDIWKYNTDLETHTVETHIHRLRKKFSSIFNDKNFIISSKNGNLIK